MYITEKNLLKYAICANAVYILLLFLFRPNGINFEKLAITSFLVFSVSGVFYLCFRNRKLLKDIPKTAKNIFYILIFWSAIVVMRGFSLNIQDWVTNFGNVYMALAWFSPIVLILGIKVENWKPVFKAIKFMFLVMLFSIVFLPSYNAEGGKLKTEWTWLLRPINFIFIIGINRFNLIGRVIIYLSFALYIVIAIFTEQRIEFIYLSFVFFFLGLIKLKHIRIKKSVVKYIIIGFVILLFLVFTYGYENISLLINKVIEFDDSRTFLFQELFTDLSRAEFYFGRGSLGTYYSPFFENIQRYLDYMGIIWYTQDSPTRITVEVGYLQMILKGGMLLFLLTFSMMIYAVYLAIFRSKNSFVRRLGIYILLITLLSLISFRPAFTPTFILLWMSIGTVLSKRNRNMSDEEINQLIKI